MPRVTVYQEVHQHRPDGFLLTTDMSVASRWWGLSRCVCECFSSHVNIVVSLEFVELWLVP